MVMKVPLALDDSMHRMAGWYQKHKLCIVQVLCAVETTTLKVPLYGILNSLSEIGALSFKQTEGFISDG